MASRWASGRTCRAYVLLPTPLMPSRKKALRVNVGLRVAGTGWGHSARRTARPPHRRLDLHNQLAGCVHRHRQHTDLAQVQPHPHNIGSHRGPPGSLIISITDSSRASTPQRGPSTTPLPTFTRRLFFFSPLELLGLATGARSVEAIDALPLGWLRETINTHSDLLSVATVWSRGLVSIAAQQVGAQPVAADPILPKVPIDAALLLWLDLLGHEIRPAVISADAATSRREFLKTAATTEPDLRSTAERAIFAIALHDAVLSTVGGIEILEPARERGERGG